MLSPVIIESPFSWARNTCKRNKYIGWEEPLKKLRKQYSNYPKIFIDYLCEGFVKKAEQNHRTILSLVEAELEKQKAANQRVQKVATPAVAVANKAVKLANTISRGVQRFKNLFHRKQG
jgi:hypothetical protein